MHGVMDETARPIDRGSSEKLNNRASITLVVILISGWPLVVITRRQNRRQVKEMDFVPEAERQDSPTPIPGRECV